MAELVLGILLLFLVWMAERGYRRGFVRTVFSVAVVLVSVLCASIFGPLMGRWLIGNETIYNAVQKQVDQIVSQQLEKNSPELNEILTNQNIKKLMGANKELAQQWENKLAQEADAWLEELPIPKKTKKLLSKELKQELGNLQDGEWTEKSIKEMVVDSLSQSILQTVGYIIVFAIMSVVMQIVFKVLIGMTRLPILHDVNKVVGMFTGLLQGIFIIWIVGVCIYMISSTQMGQDILEVIYSNKALVWIYENNIFLLSIQ